MGNEIMCCSLFDRLTVFSEKNVPIFGPPLPCPPVFSNHQEFRDFLLVKCKSVLFFQNAGNIPLGSPVIELCSSLCFQ